MRVRAGEKMPSGFLQAGTYASSILASALATPATFATPTSRSNDLGMSSEELIRITVFANRNPKLFEYEFSGHWASKHGPVITLWLQRHGIVKYVQVSFPLFEHRQER
jgi:hypothetical protein